MHAISISNRKNEMKNKIPLFIAISFNSRYLSILSKYLSNKSLIAIVYREKQGHQASILPIDSSLFKDFLYTFVRYITKYIDNKTQ